MNFWFKEFPLPNGDSEITIRYLAPSETEKGAVEEIAYRGLKSSFPKEIQEGIEKFKPYFNNLEA